MSSRAMHLADRVEEGAALLAAFATGLTEAEWKTVVPPDGRTAGVIVHHVGHLYPIEMEVIRQAVAGQAITGLTWSDIAMLNAEHAREKADVGKAEALRLLAKNSHELANEIRQLTDADLDRAVPFSLSGHAPMTVQFIIEDHPLKHPWHHMAKIRRALAMYKQTTAAAA